MVRSKKATDPVTIFDAGKNGIRTICRALASDTREVQLAAARLADAAARQLPVAIEEELRAAGNASRRARA